MRKLLIFACIFVFLGAGCSPSTPIGSTPTVVPTVAPTIAPTVIVENPPPCPEAELVYHPQLQQMLLVNCVENANQENPNVIWGWNGKQWQRVTEGGPLRRILGGVSYDEKRDVLVLYGGRPVALGRCNRETWEWDGQTWSKKDVQPPTACDHVKMVYDAASGATTTSTFFSLTDKTWVLRGGSWRDLHPASSPSKRGGPAMAYDPARKRIVLYGGFDASRKNLGDTWEWDGQGWTCLVNCQ